MEVYKTIRNRASAEQVIERSRFIAHISPVETREEADAFIDEIKATYRDATHNVPAMVIGDKQQIQWGSDDGEPQGTSGAPMVQLIVSEGLTNLVVVVTRYFGGIKLGTGGLVRAYSSSARLAIEEAGICRVCDMRSIVAVVDYSSFEKIKRGASDSIGEGPLSEEAATDAEEAEGSMRFVIEDVEYTDKVTLTLLTHEEWGDALTEMITNMTVGNAQITGSESVRRKIV